MYIDLHTHTLLSDGNYSAEQLIQMALDNNISHLAMTDHNKVHTDIEKLRVQYPDIELISASEISSKYITSRGEQREVHIVGLFLEQTEYLKSFLRENCDDGKSRVTKILKKLKQQGVDLGCESWEELHDCYFPERKHIGRPQIASVIVKKGYADSVDGAMDTYIGDYGERRAFVQSDHKFADMQSVVEMIHCASGCAVLAHPLSYKLSEDEIIELIKYFKNRGGDAMEVYYRHYSNEDSKKLQMLADQYGFLASCGSDFHGKRSGDRLNHNFPAQYLEALRRKHMEYKKS